MKKILCVLMVLFAIFNFANNVNAEEEVGYINLIDSAKIRYDQSKGLFYSEQNISLTENKTYTLIASVKFFGTALKSDDALDGQYLGTTAVVGNTKLNMFKLDYSVSGLYVSEYTPTDDCLFVINDFLARGYTMSTIPLSSVILYEGTPDDFMGFRTPEYFPSYNKVGSVVNIYSDVENPIDISMIHRSLTVNDNSDGPLEEIELILNEYSNYDGVGIYSIIYSIVDYSDNETTLTVRVHLCDVNAPVIYGDDLIEWDAHTSKPSEEDIVSRYTASDSYDGDVTASLYVIDSNLDEYEIGSYKSYQVTLQAMDLAGNTATKVVTIATTDKEKPKLEVKDVTCGLSELSVRRLENLPFEVIVSTSDNSGSFTTSYTCEEYYENVGFAGKYAVTITLTDRSGNSITKAAYVTIVDDIKPEFYMKIELLETYTTTQYSMDDIKNAIKTNLTSNGILFDELLVVSCDYINNEDIAGEYSVKYMYSYNGEKNYAIGIINVLEEESEFEYEYLVLFVPLFMAALFISRKKIFKKKTR